MLGHPDLASGLLPPFGAPTATFQRLTCSVYFYNYPAITSLARESSSLVVGSTHSAPRRDISGLEGWVQQHRSEPNGKGSSPCHIHSGFHCKTRHPAADNPCRCSWGLSLRLVEAGIWYLLTGIRRAGSGVKLPRQKLPPSLSVLAPSVFNADYLTVR